MNDYIRGLPAEIYSILIKIIIPAFVAVSIKLAIQSKSGKLSVFNVISSIIIGVGCAYLCSGWIMNTFSDNNIALVTAVITITGEKVAFWLIYKFNFDVLGDALIEEGVEFIKRRFGSNGK